MMKKNNLKDIAVIIAVSYTIVSLSYLVLEWFLDGEISKSQQNLLQIFVYSTIFVVLIMSFKQFDQISPLKLLIIELIITEGLILGGLYLTSFFIEVHPNGYRDTFITTIIPFLIGGGIFHFLVQSEVKQQNKLLIEIKRKNLD